MIKYRVFEDLKSELRGWDISSVARSADVAQATIYFWLEGRTKTPRIDTITKVADVIGFELALARKQVKLKMVS